MVRSLRPPKALEKISTVCGSLRGALAKLDKDRDFLKTGGVFDDDFIDACIELKMPWRLASRIRWSTRCITLG
jgi:glutamine synthetase